MRVCLCACGSQLFVLPSGMLLRVGLTRTAMTDGVQEAVARADVDEDLGACGHTDSQIGHAMQAARRNRLQ